MSKLLAFGSTPASFARACAASPVMDGGGLVVKAHGLCASLNSKLESNKEEKKMVDASIPARVSGNREVNRQAQYRENFWFGKVAGLSRSPCLFSSSLLLSSLELSDTQTLLALNTSPPRNRCTFLKTPLSVGDADIEMESFTLNDAALGYNAPPKPSPESYMKRDLNEKLSGNEVYYT